MYIGGGPLLPEMVMLRSTVWKFQDFSVTQILREINFWDSKNAKLAILTHLEALNFDFQEFLHFLKAVIYQIDKIQSPKNIYVRSDFHK